MSDNGPQKLEFSAACACSAVHLRLSGKPLSMMLCTCHDCQKASGTGHSALLLVRTADVRVKGEVRGFAVTANSGHPVTRHFCPVCGTPIYGQPQQYPDLRLLPAGIFADNDWFHPNAVIFHRSHADWDILPDIPSFETYKEEQS